MSHLHIPFRIRTRSRDVGKPISLRNWFAVFGASLAAFMAVLDIQVSNASLREIQSSLGLDLTEGGWISTSYLIAETIMIPLTGYLSEAFGIRRFVLGNCILFILSSVLCGLSWNLESMIVFRSLQGLSGGALVPMAFQILLIFIPPERRNLSMVIFGLTATLAPTIGPTLGGWLTESFGWRYIFFINILPGFLMCFFIYKGINGSKINWLKLKDIDKSGVITLSIGLGTLVYILEEGAKKSWFEDIHIQICTLISILTISLFIVIQLHKKKPLLNLYALSERNFLITSIITMVSGAALYGGIYSLSIYLGQIQNYSARDIGSVIMWLGVPQLIVMPLLPLLMKKIDLKFLIIIGILIFAYSNYINAFMDMNYGGDQVRLSLFLRAIGQPLFMIPVSVVGMSLVDHKSAGNASSLFNMLRNIGGSIGVSISGTFLISRQKIHESEYLSAVENGNSLMNEFMYKIELLMRSKGFDLATAHNFAVKTVKTIAMRDSFIQSFNDIFFILSVSLAALPFVIIWIKVRPGVKLSENVFE